MSLARESQSPAPSDRSVASGPGGADVIDLAEARDRRAAAQSWDSAPTIPEPRAVVPSPSSQPYVPQPFPHPQEGPDKGTMQLWDGFEPLLLPGRCVLCGFHVPTQLHRRYCPNVGKSDQQSQHPMFNTPKRR